MSDQDTWVDVPDAPAAAPAKEEWVDVPEDGAQTSTISEPAVPKATTYIPDKNVTLEHPADMSHDQLNDSIQTEIYGRPRNLSFKFDPSSPTLGAEETAVQEGVQESEKFIPEQAKAVVRMAESVPKGISALIGVMGDAGVEKAKELLGPDFDATVSRGFADMGNNAYEFYKDRGEKGWEAPDPETFRGSFMSNPSVTRLAADVIQSVPLVAATAIAATSTGGAAPLALFGSMAAGETGKAAEEHGETPEQALAVGTAAGIGNAVLMSLPIGKWMAQAGLKGGVAGAASFGLLDTAMTPFNNTIAKVGGDHARKLWDGYAESLLAMAASGFTLGSFEPGGAAQHDADVSAAVKAGVTPGEIDAQRAEIAKQMVENPDLVKAALLERMQDIKFEAPKAETKNEGGPDTSFAFGENDKKNQEAAEKALSPEETELKKNIEDAQRTVADYEAKQDLVSRIGKFRKPAGDVLKEELSQVSRRFFTTDENAESIDEVADRLGMTTNELLDQMKELSKTTVAADKTGYKNAQKFLAETDEKAAADLKERARVEAEAGREFVKNEPFTFNIGKNDKTTAENIREEASGMRDAQRARGYQFREELQRLLPDPTDQRALFWYRAADGDVEFLKEAKDAEEMEPYKDAIDRASNPSETLLKAADRLEKFYKEWGDVGQEIGILPEDLRAAYQAGWYKPEKPTDFVKNEGGGGLQKLSTEHGRGKIYDNPFEAIQSGKELATDNALEAMHKYNLDMATVATNRKLANSMTETGLASWVYPRKLPDGWEQVGTIARDIPLRKEGEPILDDNGNQYHSRMILAAPKGIAKGLEASTDPNYLAKIDAARGLSKFQQIIKTADVSLGFFHDWNIAKASFYSRGLQDLMDLKNLQAKFEEPDFKEQELHLIRNGGTTIASHPNTDVMSSLREYMASLGESDDPGILEKAAGKIVDKAAQVPGVEPVAKAAKGVVDKGEEVIDAHKDFLFNEMMRYLKVKDYASQMSNWAAAHPEAANDEVTAAARGFAEHVNAKYGGLNWEALGFSKTHVGLLRLAEFAPDWTQSKIEMVKQAVGGGTAGSASRKYLGTSLAAGMLLAEGLNHILTGHFTNENEKGHFMEVEMAPGVHVSMLPGVVEDIANLTARIVSGGPIEGGLAWAQGKLSPAMRLVAMAMSRTLYSGAPVVQRAHRGEPFSMTYDWLKAIMSEGAPVPFAASSITRYLASDVEKKFLAALAVASGIGKFSEQHKAKGQSLA